jgi:hypothetical protein
VDGWLTGNYPETGLWEVRTARQFFGNQKIRPPLHDQPELVLLFASPIPVCFGLCASSVLNLHDRIQGSQVTVRLTVGHQEKLGLHVLGDPLCAKCEAPSASLP